MFHSKDPTSAHGWVLDNVARWWYSPSQNGQLKHSDLYTPKSLIGLGYQLRWHFTKTSKVTPYSKDDPALPIWCAVPSVLTTSLK